MSQGALRTEARHAHHGMARRRMRELCRSRSTRTCEASSDVRRAMRPVLYGRDTSESQAALREDFDKRVEMQREREIGVFRAELEDWLGTL